MFHQNTFQRKQSLPLFSTIQQGPAINIQQHNFQDLSEIFQPFQIVPQKTQISLECDYLPRVLPQPNLNGLSQIGVSDKCVPKVQNTTIMSLLPQKLLTTNTMSTQVERTSLTERKQEFHAKCLQYFQRGKDSQNFDVFQKDLSNFIEKQKQEVIGDYCKCMIKDQGQPNMALEKSIQDLTVLAETMLLLQVNEKLQSSMTRFSIIRDLITCPVLISKLHQYHQDLNQIQTIIFNKLTNQSQKDDLQKQCILEIKQAFGQIKVKQNLSNVHYESQKQILQMIDLKTVSPETIAHALNLMNKYQLRESALHFLFGIDIKGIQMMLPSYWFAGQMESSQEQCSQQQLTINEEFVQLKPDIFVHPENQHQTTEFETEAPQQLFIPTVEPINLMQLFQPQESMIQIDISELQNQPHQSMNQASQSSMNLTRSPQFIQQIIPVNENHKIRENEVNIYESPKDQNDSKNNVFKYQIFANNSKSDDSVPQTIPNVEDKANKWIIPTSKAPKKKEETTMSANDIKLQKFKYLGIPDDWHSMTKTFNQKTRRYNYTFKCLRNGCNKEFAKSSKLRNHFMKHINFRPFQCHLCFTTFTLKENLKRHLKNVHNGEPMKEQSFNQLLPMHSPINPNDIQPKKVKNTKDKKVGEKRWFEHYIDEAENQQEQKVLQTELSNRIQNE